MSTWRAAGLVALGLLLVTAPVQAAAPVTAAKTCGGDASATTSHSFAYPTGMTGGQLVIVGVACRNSVGNTITWTGATPITQLQQRKGNDVDTSSSLVVSTGYRFTTGAEGANFTFTTSVSDNCAYVARRITGAHGTTPPAALDATGPGSTSPNPPNLDPGDWATEEALWIAAEGNSDASITVTQFPQTPSVFGNTQQCSTTGTPGATMADAELASTVSAVDPGAFTISATALSVAVTIGIRPAAGATLRRGILGGGIGPGVITGN